MDDSVSDVMTKDLTSVEPDASVADAAAKMRDADIGAILVIEDDELKGVLTDRDVAVEVTAQNKDPEDVKVSEIASGDVETLSPDDSLDDALRRMREQKVRRLPVVEDGKPVGIVTLGDIAAEREPDSALGEISDAPADHEGSSGDDGDRGKSDDDDDSDDDKDDDDQDDDDDEDADKDE